MAGVVRVLPPMPPQEAWVPVEVAAFLRTAVQALGALVVVAVAVLECLYRLPLEVLAETALQL